MTTKKPTYKLVKLDKRHMAWDLFSHRLEVFNTKEFLDMREQFWKEYGPGCERNFAHARNQHSGQYASGDPVQWAWHVDHNISAKYLYLADGPALTHFQLSRT